jgi:hypothetical protein
MTDLLDRRLLGAVRFVDVVTGTEVLSPLRVSAPGVRWVRNLRGWFVAASAPGLDAHTLTIDKPPAQPAPGKTPVALSVDDPTGRYLPRGASLALPRDPDPGKKEAAASLFTPAEVELYPSPTAPVSPGWAVIRASVVTKGQKPVSGALLRVSRKSGELLGRGMTDARGEGLVGIAGIPVTTWDDEGQEGVLAREMDARLDVLWSPQSAGDPEVLPKVKPVATQELKLASGRTITLRIVTSA